MVKRSIHILLIKFNHRTMSNYERFRPPRLHGFEQIFAWTYKNLLGSTLCLHGTGGTGWNFERLSVQVWDLLFSGPKLAHLDLFHGSEWCMLINNTRRQVFPKVPKVRCNRQSFIHKKTRYFDLITALLKNDETGLMRNRFYFCRCVVVIYDTKVIYRFAISFP